MALNQWKRQSGPQMRTAARVCAWCLSTGAAVSGAIAARFRSLFQRHAANDRIEHLKDARWQLTETEARLRELLDSQSDLIVRRDGTGRVTFANIAFCKTFGIVRDAARGQLFWPAVLASEPAFANTGSCARVVEQLATVDGPRWIEWDTHRTVAADGQSETQLVGRDVTHERDLKAELRDARDNADAANRAKSRFLAAMSHEIRTPMNGILGMSSLLQETDQTDEQRSYTRAIDVSAKSLLALIDEILDFSKIEAGKMQLAVAPFSLRAGVASALELMSPNASRRGNRLAQTIANDIPPLVMGDAARVRQIILNLVSNAVKFTENGDIDVFVRRIADAGPSAALYELVVKDTGIGFSEETMAVLFHEFEQAEDLRNGRQSGTGLGLAISKRLARAMGGDIRAEGRPGKGATFTVTFALADHVRTDVLPAPEEPEVPSQPKHITFADREPPRILLAEDNEINALLARRVCERSGCIVVAVSDGLQAVDAIERSLSPGGKPFDLVLMDVFMPHLDGIEATRAIKALWPAGALRTIPCPPVIALTANAFAEDRDRCLQAGMDDYLAKPFDTHQLRAVLERWMPQHETRRAG